MISRHIPIKAQYDNYSRLADYIAKIDEATPPFMLWHVGGDGLSYEDAKQEAADVQAMHTRTDAQEKNRTYHLIVSFHPEDEAKLTPEVMREIEKEFAVCLGLSEHQRHSAVHTDTANMHLHVAYNLIHPERFTRHEPWNDNHRRDALCRRLEREYGITIDNGIERKDGERKRNNEKARAVEKHRKEESFQAYALRQKDAIMIKLKEAETWQDVHSAFAAYGLEVRPKANGLALVNIHGNHGLKASDFDRSLSKKKLEGRFSPFEKPDGITVDEIERYQGKPIVRSAACIALREHYDQLVEARLEAQEALKLEQAAKLEVIKAKWENERASIAALKVYTWDRRKLEQYARQQQKAEIAAARAQNFTEREAFEKKHPYESWPQFLIRQAQAGNRAALGVLRQREKHIGPDANKAKEPAPEEDAIPWKELAELRAEIAARNAGLLDNADLNRQGRKNMQGIYRMEQAERGQALKEPQAANVIDTKITKQGVLIMTLENGGTVKDTGQEIRFSPDGAAAKLAQEYALLKWGRRTRNDEGVIMRDKARKGTRQRYLAPGLCFAGLGAVKRKRTANKRPQPLNIPPPPILRARCFLVWPPIKGRFLLIFANGVLKHRQLRPKILW